LWGEGGCVTPVVERGITEAVLPAQFLDRHASLSLLQKTDDLLF